LGKQQANPFADVSDPSKDLWLVIKVGAFELPLLPDHKIQKTTQPDGSTVFSIPSPQSRSGAGPTAQVVLPPPSNQEDTEDYETFEILLKQYGCLPSSQVSRAIKGAAAIVAPPLPTTSAPGSGTSTPQGTPDQRGGRFVLVDEGTGQVIGELDNRIDVEVGKDVNAGSSASSTGDHKMNDPVMVDFGVLDEGWAQKVTVQTIDEQDMNDWMLKGAHYIRYVRKGEVFDSALMRNIQQRTAHVWQHGFQIHDQRR
jgi:spartin